MAKSHETKNVCSLDTINIHSKIFQDMAQINILNNPPFKQFAMEILNLSVPILVQCIT